MTDSNVVYGVDFKGHSEAVSPDVPDQLLILPVIRTERQDTSPCEYVAPLWHQPGTADANGVPIADESV